MHWKSFKYALLGIITIVLFGYLYSLQSDLSKLKAQVKTTPLSFGYSKETKTLNLYFSNYQGLGNRLKYLVSYIRYYQPKNIQMNWPNRGWVSSRFSDLFVLDLPIKLTERNALLRLSEKNLAKANPLFDYVNTWGLIIAKTDYDKDEKPQAIDFRFNDIPLKLIDIYKPYFTHIHPSTAVKKRISEINLPKKAVSVQVRIAPDWEEYYGRNESLSSFFEVMDTFPTDTVFYLSAMSKDISDEFNKRYPNRIIELPNKDYYSMVDAVADMYILGSTDNILCSFHSTFCEVAWWLNGAKANVTIIGSADGWTITPTSIKIIDDIPIH